MKLHVVERIKLTQLLPFPKEGSRMSFKIIDDLLKDLSFSEKEYKEFKIKEDAVTGQVSWENSKEKEIPIGEIASDVICEALARLDKAGKFDIYCYGLSNKFDLDSYLKEQEERKQVPTKAKK